MRFLKCFAIGALIFSAGVGVASPVAQRSAETALTAPSGSSATAEPAQGDGRHLLTKQDADAWLDGFLPYALRRADIPGAVVVIVKDGKIVTERGFGYADVASRTPVDPVRTLFRPGSVSKLYTWTAVMQLVEAGKINLDADINTYLDFKIPAFKGRPITVRNLMTHTTGFEESSVDIVAYKLSSPTLGAALKRWIPARVNAPGSTPAYSNYGAGLAAYIVERVSGLSYDDYVERNIFQRLGMTYATFRQPLPANLRPFMAKGYEPGVSEPKPYEIIAMSGVGGAAISGHDMAKFMIAHLENGGALLNPATARLMHSSGSEQLPGLARMMLGFYEHRLNGLSAIEHGGDTFWFHSNLSLFLQKNVGIYISMNSPGKDASSSAIRSSLVKDFADRYFPAPSVAPKELTTAREHARLAAGTYTSSRASVNNWGAVLYFLEQITVSTDKDGRLAVPAFKTIGGASRTWIEIAPFLWQSATDDKLLGAKVENGAVVRIVDNPISVWNRVPWYKSSSWLMPAAVAALGVLLLAGIAWPFGAIIRKRYGVAQPLSGRSLGVSRSTAALSWIVLAVVAGWATVIGIVTTPGADTPFALIWLLEICGTIVFVGLAGFAVWNASLAWKGGRGWLSRLWNILIVLAAFVMLWVAIVTKLISFGAYW